MGLDITWSQVLVVLCSYVRHGDWPSWLDLQGLLKDIEELRGYDNEVSAWGEGKSNTFVFFFLMVLWVRSRNCGCLVTWFCYQLIAKPGNKTATVSWPDPYAGVVVILWSHFSMIDFDLILHKSILETVDSVIVEPYLFCVIPWHWHHTGY